VSDLSGALNEASSRISQGLGRLYSKNGFEAW